MKNTDTRDNSIAAGASLAVAGGGVAIALLLIPVAGWILFGIGVIAAAIFGFRAYQSSQKDKQTSASPLARVTSSSVYAALADEVRSSDYYRSYTCSTSTQVRKFSSSPHSITPSKTVAPALPITTTSSPITTTPTPPRPASFQGGGGGGDDGRYRKPDLCFYPSAQSSYYNDDGDDDDDDDDDDNRAKDPESNRRFGYGSRYQ